MGGLPARGRRRRLTPEPEDERKVQAPRTLVISVNDRIVIDPNICHGKPVIRGTRTPVAIVVGSLAGGMSFEDVQRE